MWSDTASHPLSRHHFSFLCSLARRLSIPCPEKGHCWYRLRLTLTTLDPLTHPAPILQFLCALLWMAHTHTLDPHRPALESPGLNLLSIRVAHNQWQTGVEVHKSSSLASRKADSEASGRTDSCSKAPYGIRDWAEEGMSPKVTVLLIFLLSLHDSPCSLTGFSQKHSPGTYPSTKLIPVLPSYA